MSKIAVIYWSGTGNTEAMAEAIVEGISANGKEASLFNVSVDVPKNITEYQAVVLGCPSMGAEVLEDSEFEPFYESVKAELTGKAVALFGSYGWGDGEWMRNWEDDIDNIGAKLFEEGLIVNESPDDSGKETCRNFGERFAKTLS